MERFPRLAATHDDALRYYENRARQLLCTDWEPVPPVERLPWGVHVRLARGGREHHSLFVLADQTGRGHLSAWRRAHPDAVFVVMDPCDAVTGWLRARGVPFEVARGPESAEYRAVERFYGDRRAARSGAFYLAHVDEGLYALRALGASDAAARGFCLHPLVQADSDLVESLALGRLDGLPADAVALALEYRRVANLHLSRHRVADPARIALSPVADVNDMLRADKIQNRADFERFHAATHPERDRLRAYFAEWFARLGIEEDAYQRIVAHVRARTEVPVVDVS